MKCTNPGHTYELANFEDKSKSQTLQFIDKKEVLVDVEGSPRKSEFRTIKDGTTNEEVLRMLIDRMYWLQQLCACRENALCITKLEEALMWLEKRTTDRVKRNVEGTPIK
jgi:hypothetical protein